MKLEIINAIFNGLTAVGTMSAVITALWLSYRDNQPRLKVYATIGVIMSTQSKYLKLMCINVGKQGIVCESFSFLPNRFKKNAPHRIPNCIIPSLSHKLPQSLEYSVRVEEFHSLEAIKLAVDAISSCKFIAKMQLRLLWRIIAHTNIKGFKGTLSDDLIDEIMAQKFGSK